MRYLILLIAFILSGCGEYTDKEGWSGNVTEQENGLTLSYDQTKFTQSLIPRVQNYWSFVLRCTGEDVDLINHPLIIEYSPDSEIPSGLAGYIIYDSSYIRVDEIDFTRQGVTTRHEMIHHLLDVLVLDKYDHSHPYFGCQFLV